MKSRLPHLTCILLAMLAGPIRGEESVGGSLLDSLVAAIGEERGKADPHNPFDGLFAPGIRLTQATVEGTELRLLFNERLVTRSWDEAAAKTLQDWLLKAATAAGHTAESVSISVRFAGAPGGGRELLFDDLITSRERVRARGAERSDRAPVQPVLPVVQRPDYGGPTITRGLLGRHYVVGPSHGFTWHKEKRWQYQRARLWTTIEDLYPLSYINPFLAPMLENAGANVYSVRERDWQTAEVIVDFPVASAGSHTRSTGVWTSEPGSGWAGGLIASMPPEMEPFTLGSTARAEVFADAPSTAVFVPFIPRDGRYAVSISWKHDPRNSPSVPVVIRHLGGETTLRVNQQVSGSTWVHLGFFEFAAGTDEQRGSVTITTEGAFASPQIETSNATAEADVAPKATTVSIDAVRFGGGMANGAPEGLTSGEPRYTEASRYFLQYLGAPREAVYLPNASEGHFGVDYNRDITARAEWPNYLTGAPSGPNSNRLSRGLGVPIDAYLSFHTDAGVDKEGVYGTLMLSRVWDGEGLDRFPDGRSRLLNRDLGNIMMDEIVRTARARHTSTWERRAHEDRAFGEARRPNVPSVILELLSHQNFNDMKYGLDPRFKFDMSRALYKSLARFTHWQDGTDPVIQPLPPLRFRLQQDGQGGAILTWEPQDDPLEPSATPTGYLLYASRDGRSFDNGTFVPNASVALTDLPEETFLAWRVTAVNEGGESFPTPTLAMRWKRGVAPLLVVDGFDRLSGPAIIEDGPIRGFDRRLDPGVGFEANYGLVGDVYDFNESSEWANDLEETGWGASTNYMESHLEPGNNFNHSVVHGRLLEGLGLPFDSATLGGFEEISRKDLRAYPGVIWIAGRQRTVDPPKGIPTHGSPDRMEPAHALMSDRSAEALLEYLGADGRLLLSGAHVAEELLGRAPANSPRARLAREGLGIHGHTERLTGPNAAQATEGPFSRLTPFRYGIDLGTRINILPTVYPVTTSDVLTGPGAGALIYANGGAAASVTPRTITLAIPLDAVLPPTAREELMQRSIAHLLPTMVPSPSE